VTASLSCATKTRQVDGLRARGLSWNQVTEHFGIGRGTAEQERHLCLLLTLVSFACNGISHNTCSPEAHQIQGNSLLKSYIVTATIAHTTKLCMTLYASYT
jgi:hypothetical protein